LNDDNRRKAEQRNSKLNSSKQIVALFPYSRRDYKRWPVDSYVDLCRALNQSNTCIPVIVSGPGERVYCDTIRSQASLSENQLQVFDDLGDLAAFLQLCSFYTGNDGGPKHLAVAMGVKTVTVFLNDPPDYWTPPDRTMHIALESTESNQIQSADVIAAMRKLGAEI
jgi:ADP-heptose:LPS heptosyltransferase